ncbi:MAG: ComEC/Rec2 family competence protein, partial [Polynucleobacter victoriensis]
MGEQNAISQKDWRVFNATGIGHLISISGLHVTMLAGVGAALANRLWRRRSLPMICPAQKVAALSGFAVALIYTWLAGFQIPAQRTMYMVGVVAVALWTNRITRAFDIWWWAL